ncbi:MAG TPA: chemotaxis protein CheX, partial [Alteromonas sp.]|nr:chemotaxis protein CheX [Alteromonas sp.]
MNAEFVNPFIAGLLNVLETMAQTTLSPGKPKRK